MSNSFAKSFSYKGEKQTGDLTTSISNALLDALNHSSPAKFNIVFFGNLALNNISSLEYGSLSKLLGEFELKNTIINSSYFVSADPAIETDPYKTNIIKIASSNYAPIRFVYSHFDGKPFNKFLPVLNGSEYFAVDSTQNNEIFIKKSPPALNYINLKDSVEKAQGETFKGFVTCRINNTISGPPLSYVKEQLTYTGRFSLTFNSLLGTSTSYLPSNPNDFFSMLITLDHEISEVLEVSSLPVGKTTRPAIKTIQINNFNFFSTSNASPMAYSYDELGNNEVEWFYSLGVGASLSLSKTPDNNSIDQVAAYIKIFRNIATSPAHTQEILLAFVSNQIVE